MLERSPRVARVGVEDLIPEQGNEQEHYRQEYQHDGYHGPNHMRPIMAVELHPRSLYRMET